MKDDVSDQYLRAARAAIDAIEANELPAIGRAADRFARTILAGRLVHVFGTGHSRMAVEEMFPPDTARSRVSIRSSSSR